ncbi:MAG: hypothetical protein KUG81_03575 [Gammaproteobacteria bacterium]|nr:hypothetical protein [Gammaproteobacteria bacterium]
MTEPSPFSALTPKTQRNGDSQAPKLLDPLPSPRSVIREKLLSLEGYGEQVAKTWLALHSDLCCMSVIDAIGFSTRTALG